MFYEWSELHFICPGFRECSIVFRIQCLCSIHSMNKVMCSEYSICVAFIPWKKVSCSEQCVWVTVTPRIHYCVQSWIFCSSHPMNTLLCSEHSVCVAVIPWTQYCVQSTVFVFSLSYEYSTGIVPLVECMPVIFLNKEINLSAQVLQKAKLVESGC